jgi:hypothetical protein
VFKKRESCNVLYDRLFKAFILFDIQACSFGYGEQMNQINHLLDGSVVYGNDDEDAKALR